MTKKLTVEEMIEHNLKTLTPSIRHTGSPEMGKILEYGLMQIFRGMFTEIAQAAREEERAEQLKQLESK